MPTENGITINGITIKLPPVKSPAAIAHHEAGHVVMAVTQGLYFDAVSIEPDGPASGEALVYPPKGFAEDSTCEDQIGKMLFMVLAGPVAERRFSGICRVTQIGADMFLALAEFNSDYARAQKLSAMLHQISPEAALTDSDVALIFDQLEYTEEQVCSLLEDYDGAGWKAVEALAAALLSRNALNRDDALAIINPLLFPGADSEAV